MPNKETNEVTVRHFNIPLEQQASALRNRKRVNTKRPQTVYTPVWVGTDHGLLELIDIRKAGTSEEHYIGVTIKASKSSSTGAINIAMHHKCVTNSRGEYVDRAKSKNLSPDEMERAAALQAQFMASVGDPETDPLGFYAAVEYDMDIRPAVTEPAESAE